MDKGSGDDACLFYLEIGTKAKPSNIVYALVTGLFYLEIGTKAKLPGVSGQKDTGLFYLEIGTKAKQLFKV